MQDSICKIYKAKNPDVKATACQGQGPEFKPQYLHQKEKEKEKKKHMSSNALYTFMLENGFSM
jgi:hypothetical protein